MPTKSACTPSWRGRAPTGRSASRRGGTPEASTMASERTRAASFTELHPRAPRPQPRRPRPPWREVAQALGTVMPAASMNALSPMASAQCVSQVAGSVEVSSVGNSPRPTPRRTDRRSRCAARPSSPRSHSRPGEVGRTEQPFVVTGENGDKRGRFPATSTSTPPERSAMSPPRTAEVRAHQTRSRSETDQCPQAHLARRRGYRREPDRHRSARPSRATWIALERADPGGGPMDQHGAGDGAQVRAHRARRGRARAPRRAPSLLDGRRGEHRPRSELEAAEVAKVPSLPAAKRSALARAGLVAPPRRRRRGRSRPPRC